MREFVCDGPVDVPIGLNRVKYIDSGRVREFWNENQRFSQKRGIYIFAIRAGRGYTPWYIGQSGVGFAQEVFSIHKISIYNEILRDYVVRGTPVLFFISPQRGNQIPEWMLNNIERYFIVAGYYRNPNIRNRQGLPQEQWRVRGLVRANQGEGGLIERRLRTMFRF